MSFNLILLSFSTSDSFLCRSLSQVVSLLVILLLLLLHHLLVVRVVKHNVRVLISLSSGSFLVTLIKTMPTLNL